MSSEAIYSMPQDAAKRIERELSQCEGYNTSIKLYDTCRRNQRFYHGDQWHGLPQNGKLQLMTQNFLQRPVSYFIAMIVTDDIGYQISPLIEGGLEDDVLKLLPDMVRRVFSRNDFSTLSRRIVKNAAIEGEGVLHLYFDADAETGETARGDIKAEVISTCSVLFGNPHTVDVQSQPYIIVKRRVPLQQLRERARLYGFGEVDKLRSDEDRMNSQINNQSGDDRVTELVKYWRESSETEKKVLLPNGKTKTIKKTVSTIHFARYASGCVIQKDTDTGLTLYPISRMSWNESQDSYHGSCPISSFIPSQIIVNQLLTVICAYAKYHGLPRLVYNRSMLQNGLSNDPTKAIAVNGEPNQSIMQILPTADVPASITNLINMLVDQTRDFMGTSDAALGNIRPDNTSAIIATQKATAAPLLLQQMAFYQFVREAVRIVIDHIANFYGQRIVKLETQPDPVTGEEIAVPVVLDFDSVNLDELELEIEVGQAAYWSELTAVQTLDNMLGNGILPREDPEAMKIYLESLPTGYLPSKAEILEYYNDIIERAQLQQQAQVVADQMQVDNLTGGTAPPEEMNVQEDVFNG